MEVYHPQGREHSCLQRPALLLVSTKNLAGSNFLNMHVHRIRFVLSATQICQIDSEHAQCDGKSVNRGLPVLDSPRGCNSWY